MTNQELTERQVSQRKTSYTHSLQSNKEQIDSTYLNQKVTTEQFRTYIRDIIVNTNGKALEDKSPATKKFLQALNRQYNKDGILQLVYNSMLKADGFGVI